MSLRTGRITLTICTPGSEAARNCLSVPDRLLDPNENPRAITHLRLRLGGSVLSRTGPPPCSRPCVVYNALTPLPSWEVETSTVVRQDVDSLFWSSSYSVGIELVVRRYHVM